jgi:hypothetical protein
MPLYCLVDLYKGFMNNALRKKNPPTLEVMKMKYFSDNFFDLLSSLLGSLP